MPAMLDDPTSPPIPLNQAPPPTISSKHITLKDGHTRATILAFTSPSQPPPALTAYLASQLALEVSKGDTYPMTTALPADAFGAYWFACFAAVMLLGDVESVDDVADSNWPSICLGSFYVKPNYPGRSSHVCNGGFLVTEGSRNRGVGKALGQTYLEWAPRLVRKQPLFLKLHVGGEQESVWIELILTRRVSRIQCSTWSMRRMSRLVVSGILWDSRGLGG
ncbi:hypothetical protein P153DRAFT_367794 [Dothidotthia symphoricarpi CBS 119687]|uniref:N-acetyltransferase domain-containing protein n=1 Tax=Dothidotthia symphoricarpi CBS 119687 TaxID=1392245 RepID=A0A6A6ACI9_9PLEO|nr:uncharacterized protein P153DRAFT_367794 [Dothidotthia symphoricarpi CBS 119687]KAF2128704.1 hypothetical protein P153DRAFT_367794 [Dothidotthia symphoricarpi CBS 119687]